MERRENGKLFAFVTAESHFGTPDSPTPYSGNSEIKRALIFPTADDWGIFLGYAN